MLRAAGEMLQGDAHWRRAWSGLRLVGMVAMLPLLFSELHGA